MTSATTDPTAKPGDRAALELFQALALLFLLAGLIAQAAGAAAPGWTPMALFGHSGAAEAFLFCTGLAIAPPLLSVFAERGLISGVLRVLHRVWQAYWRYLGALLAAAALALLIAGAQSPQAREGALRPIGLEGLSATPNETLLGIASLAAQPSFAALFFVYLAALAAALAAIAIGRMRPWAALSLSGGLYIIAQLGLASPTGWLLNPLAWQLPLVAGIAFAAGWLPKPQQDKRAALVALAVLILGALSAPDALIGGLWRGAPAAFEAEHSLGPARLLHFAALAYLAWRLSDRIEIALRAPAPHRFSAAMTRRAQTIGAQSLTSLTAAYPIAALCGALAASSPLLSPPLSLVVFTALGAALLAMAAAAGAWIEAPSWSRPAKNGAQLRS